MPPLVLVRGEADVAREEALAVLAGAPFDRRRAVREQLACLTGTDRTELAIAALRELRDGGWSLADSVLAVHEGMDLSLGRTCVLAARVVGASRREFALDLRRAGVADHLIRRALGGASSPSVRDS